MSCLTDRVRRVESRVGSHIAAHYGTAPATMLGLLRADVQEVHALAAGSTVAVRTRLSEIFALLVTMSADVFLMMGDVRRARRGFLSAERAADATGNEALQACVRSYHSLLPYYYGHIGEAVDLARAAQQLLPETGGATAALAYATAARALARGGEPAGAREALWRSEALLDGSPVTDDSMGFGRTRFLLYASGALTYIGDDVRARAVQDEALQLYDGDPYQVLPAALIRLDRALGLAERGDVIEACRLARAVAEYLPDEHRGAIVVRRASDVLSAVPDPAKASAPAAELRRLLNTLRRPRLTAAC